jgi:hypothetical protein
MTPAPVDLRRERRKHLQIIADAMNDAVLFASVRHIPTTDTYYLMVYNQRNHITERILRDPPGEIWGRGEIGSLPRACQRLSPLQEAPSRLIFQVHYIWDAQGMDECS